MNKPLTAGTTATVSAPLPTGRTPTTVRMWAAIDGNASAPVSIPASVVGNVLTGKWTPPVAGTWTVGAKVVTPDGDITGTARVVVRPLPRAPRT